MGFGGKGKGGSSNNGLDPEVQKGLLENETALVNIAQQQSLNAQKLFGLTEPGLVTAENYYETLASGDPYAIMRATAPAAQQVGEATAGAKANIMANAPPGGEKALALEMTDVARGSKLADLTSGAFTGAPNALAQLAGQGIGESISSAGTGLSGLSSAESALASLGGLQLQSQQIQAEQKGNVLGSISGLAGSIFEAAGAAGGFGTLFAGI